MARPTVLIADRNETRRKDVSRALSGFAYEVITASDGDEGRRFATGLKPGLIVADEEIEGFADGSILAEIDIDEGEAVPRVVIMGSQDEASEQVAESISYVSVAGLTSVAVIRKLRTFLLSMELPLEADARFEALIGDLQSTPLFELLQLLQRSVVSGRVVLADGELNFADGELIAARSGKVRGIKGVARLARGASGTFKLLVGAASATREMSSDLLSITAASLEDQHTFEESRAALPELNSRVRIEMGPSFFATNFTPSQQKVFECAQGTPTIWALLDLHPDLDGKVLEELTRLHELGFVQFEEPEIRVRVVTDSTSDIPPEIALRHGIHVVPLSVMFGKETLIDGVDITPGAFYKRLEAERDIHPKTSPPSKGEFLTAYRLLASRSEIVSVHISERMSQTVVHAREAAAEGVRAIPPRENGAPPEFKVVDGTQVSIGLGLLAIFASRMARRGLAADVIREHLEAMRSRCHLLFVVDTLEYLARGGRIGRARALVGNILGIKPILGVVDGEVAAVDKVRGGKQAHPRLIELFKERLKDGEGPVIVGLAHANAPVWAQRLRALIEQSFTVAELIESEIGPVVGTHAGPGTVGAMVFRPTDEELPLIAPFGEE